MGTSKTTRRAVVAASILAATAAAGTTTAAATTASTTASTSTSGAYLVNSHTATTNRLQLVDLRTGAVRRTVASVPAKGRGSAVWQDATIAPDGTVWAVKVTSYPYGSTLVRIRDGRTTSFMPYVQAARVSPDGRRLAVTVVSPDTNRDGLGTMSLRVGSVSGVGGFRTIAQDHFGVQANGDPATEVAAPMVTTWLGTHHVVITRGCCDSGQAVVVDADHVSRPQRWRGVDGDWATRPVARFGHDAVLVPKAVEAGKGTNESPAYTVAYDVFRVSVAHPLGVKVARVPARYGATDALTTYVARSGATPMDPEVASLRYQAPAGSQLVDSYLQR